MNAAAAPIVVASTKALLDPPSASINRIAPKVDRPFRGRWQIKAAVSAAILKAPSKAARSTLTSWRVLPDSHFR
jgi:hypothetical protein